MKKFLCTVALMMLGAASAFAEAKVGFWFDCPEKVSSNQVRGVAFGIPLSSMSSVNGAELSILCSASNKISGFQWAYFGINSTFVFQRGCQLSFANFVRSEISGKGFQVGLYNQSARKGFQIGFVNRCLNNAFLQVGLVNINENGLFPVMIFVNFDKNFFD